MARIFITGSSDGLGAIAARALIAQGHSVTVHARNVQRAQDALAAAPGAAGCLVADLSSISQTKNLAAEANKTGRFDIVMHNAGLGYKESFRETEDGLASVFAVNSLAPYILTCLMERPKRLIYLSSGLHRGGKADFSDITWTGRSVGQAETNQERKRRWDPLQAYSDAKLQDIILAFAVARRWGGESAAGAGTEAVESNACSPGWVNTKMGGTTAPGTATEGARTQILLADMRRHDLGSGGYWVGGKKDQCHAIANDVGKQEEYLRICGELSGVEFPK